MPLDPTFSSDGRRTRRRMAADSDADEIQRDREHRQAAERRRIDGERQRRRAELARLRAFEDGTVPPGEGRRPPGSPRAAPASRPGGSVPPPEGPTRTPIGAPIRPDSVGRLLAFDPADGFDLEALNAVPLHGLARSVADDPELAGALETAAHAS